MSHWCQLTIRLTAILVCVCIPLNYNNNSAKLTKIRMTIIRLMAQGFIGSLRWQNNNEIMKLTILNNT